MKYLNIFLKYLISFFGAYTFLSNAWLDFELTEGLNYYTIYILITLLLIQIVNWFIPLKLENKYKTYKLKNISQIINSSFFILFLILICFVAYFFRTIVNTTDYKIYAFHEENPMTYEEYFDLHFYRDFMYFVFYLPIYIFLYLINDFSYYFLIENIKKKLNKYNCLKYPNEIKHNK
ncbi:hypothetical protein [Mycoplasmopsis gallinacea]|uniref:Uncharacterized protein n=1 Tax=Mycoplasmopsis gallinacea TaxID=29556 RepID=A0A449A2X8_9BACT|nr:hypothetical protein [Mycoplasmopsis gallinacea]VEU58601.1 Uncharacterised protein [Mycoplasmopsis gallinacea]